MHLPLPRSVDAAVHQWLRVWALLLVAPACLALVTMPVEMIAVAITLAFGMPCTTWLVVHAQRVRDVPAHLPAALRLAAGVSVSFLGFVGLFLFSLPLGVGAFAAYAATLGVMLARPRTRSSSRSTSRDTALTSVVLTHDTVRQMSDAAICRAWRDTFEALQRARGLHLRTLIVETRQLLLDEVADRHPVQVQAWLESGAHTAGGPERFIGPVEGSGGHPEAA